VQDLVVALGLGQFVVYGGVANDQNVASLVIKNQALLRQLHMLLAALVHELHVDFRVIAILKESSY
jgi:hypothetical protein